MDSSYLALKWGEDRKPGYGSIAGGCASLGRLSIESAQ